MSLKMINDSLTILHSVVLNHLEREEAYVNKLGKELAELTAKFESQLEVSGKLSVANQGLIEKVNEVAKELREYDPSREFDNAMVAAGIGTLAAGPLAPASDAASSPDANLAAGPLAPASDAASSPASDAASSPDANLAAGPLAPVANPASRASEAADKAAAEEKAKGKIFLKITDLQKQLEYLEKDGRKDTDAYKKIKANMSRLENSFNVGGRKRSRRRKRHSFRRK